MMRGPLPTRCQRCSSSRLARVRAHCSDLCSVDLAGRHLHDYVPRDLGIGGGDDVGDRVRVTQLSQVEGYRPGDKGTVHRVDVTSRGVLYHVAMDKAGATGTTVIFTEGVIEPDV
jgi:hypothetical protein